jgi:hypothetical protein
MKTVIVMRMCPDYSKLTKENFADQIQQPYVPRTELRIMIDSDMLNFWDKHYRISYIDYRAKLAEMTRKNLAATGCQIFWGYQQFMDWYAADDEEAIIVPIDDDDYFCPHIAEVANEFANSTKVLIWRNAVIHTVSRFFFALGDDYRMCSNNWAVRKSYLKTLDPKQARHLVLLSHIHAGRFVHKHIPAGVKKVDKHFNLYNRHGASLAFMRDKIASNYYEEEFIPSSKYIPSKCDIPWQFAWSDDIINQLVKLNITLRKPIVTLL